MTTKTRATKPLSVTKNASKPKTRFQKLWDEAERVKKQNLELEESLDKLVQRMETEVGPIELELGHAMRAQIDKLIVFAGRKSLSQWQIHVLDEWIITTMDFLHSMGLVDEALTNNLAQLHAKSLGIDIDANSDISVTEQLKAGMDAQFAEADFSDEDDLYDFDEDEIEDEEFMQFLKEKIAQMEQENTDNSERSTGHGNEQNNNESADDVQPQDSELPITVFKKLFHRVARALHPDKETDPEKRQAKQALMSELLDARRQHDLMQVIELYRNHVNDTTDFNEQELEGLEQVLEQYIDNEHLRVEEITRKSYKHEIVFHELFSFDPKKTERAIVKRIKQIKTEKKQIESFTASVTSLQKLKPHLERRHDELTQHLPW